jgi:hypothetical protein
LVSSCNNDIDNYEMMLHVHVSSFVFLDIGTSPNVVLSLRVVFTNLTRCGIASGSVRRYGMDDASLPRAV